MVRNTPFLPRDIYSPRDQWSTNDRYMSDPSISPNHFSNPSSSRSPVAPPLAAIETALRERCGIHVKDFAMIATLDDGTTATFTSEKLVAHEKYLFSEQFKAFYFRQTEGAGSGNLTGHYGFPASTSYGDFETTTMRRQSSSTDSSHGNRRHRNRFREESIQEDSEDEDTILASKSRRKRPRGAQDNDDDKPPPMAPSMRFRNLTIGDKAEVTKFFEGRFRDMQQASCKIIAKAFVKVVEPKKQTNHPYTGGAERAPEWWPPLPSDNKPGGVKHREPDHLLKPERIALLIHILRLGYMTGENMQHVIVKDLEAKSKEMLVAWVNEKPGNKAKMKYLQEIFKVAKQEEKYCRGEIDASTIIPVMHGADLAVPDASEDEGGDDNVKDENFEDMTPQSTQQICTPESMVSPTSTHSNSSLNRPLSSNTMSGFGSYTREIPVRQYQPASPPSDQPNYENDSLSMGVQSFLPSRMSDLQQHPNHGLPDNTRRPTWHNSNSFPSANSMFSNWSNNNNMMPTSSVQYGSYPAPSSAPLTSSGPLLPHPNTSSTLLPPMHLQNTQQQNSGSNFHDPSSPAMNFRDQNSVGSTHNSLRTGSLSNPHHQYHAQQSSYLNEYLHDYSQSDSVMKDENIGSGGS